VTEERNGMAYQQGTDGVLRELALFAGAGGGILGGKLLGWRTVCAVEIEPYAASVLMQRQNDGILDPFPVWDDVCSFDGRPWRGRIDVVSGGFPCQAWSNAAAGNNTAGNYWPQMLRIVGEVCPKLVSAENVDEGAILMAQKDLADCGYETIRCKLSAADLGADHVRARWWLLAYTDHEGKLRRAINAKVGMLPELCTGVWSTYPDESGMVDGVADRMDRFKAIGNGQIPAVAAMAWQILSRQPGNCLN
jgi:DNA (cytosine-5)-methyltransferase 1